MLVGIEASAAVVSGRTGVGTYTANIIAGLQRLAAATGELDFVYFSNRTTAPHEGAVSPAGYEVYPHNQLRSRMLWMQLGLPRSLAATRPDICHFPNYLAPVLGSLRKPYVVTMHDMSVYRCPEHQPLKTVAVHRAMLPALARRTSLVVTVSESARVDILRYLKLPPERVRVVYEGIGPQFRPQNQTGQPDTPEVRRRYDLSFPFILTVGTLEPRKNHRRLIQAFTQLAQQERIPHHLVIAGTRGWKDRSLYVEARRSKVADRIHVLGYVPGLDLPGLYRAADAFAFPSLYEGFGLPVLEALACGVPSLISTNAALTEVAGEGTAVVVNPESVDDIAGGLHRLLCDLALTRELRLRGFARAREFSWDKCAADTVELYREVLDERPQTTRLYAAR